MTRSIPETILLRSLQGGVALAMLLLISPAKAETPDEIRSFLAQAPIAQVAVAPQAETGMQNQELELLPIPEPSLDKQFDQPWHGPRTGPEPFRQSLRRSQRRRPWLLRMPLPEFIHSDPDDPLRHIGIGQPLEGTSWLNRPYHFDLFAGGMFGDRLIDNGLNQGNSLFSGVRIGWDFDHYWGTEGRFAFANLDTFDPQDASFSQESKNEFFDAHLLYYPWGDAALRPYLSAGMGVARFNFNDNQGRSLNEALFHLPLGFGFKYHFRNWITLRFDFKDNIAFSSSRTAGMHNLSLSGGTEFRFGGRRRSYAPFHP